MFVEFEPPLLHKAVVGPPDRIKHQFALRWRQLHFLESTIITFTKDDYNSRMLHKTVYRIYKQAIQLSQYEYITPNVTDNSIMIQVPGPIGIGLKVENVATTIIITLAFLSS